MSEIEEEKSEEIIEEEKSEEITDEEIESTEGIESTGKDEDFAEEGGLLLPRDTLLSAGTHIGTRMKMRDMEQFIYRVRPDGLFVLDIQKTDERIRTTAKFLARMEPSKVAVTATRLYAQEPVRKFCDVTGANPIVGRFTPGSLSNPLYPERIEPDVLVVSDPRADAQAVREASLVGIPIVALCSTDNILSGIDLVIPTNNKGRRALAVVYWLLARQVLRERGELQPDEDLDLTVDDFEVSISGREEYEG